MLNSSVVVNALQTYGPTYSASDLDAARPADASGRPVQVLAFRQRPGWPSFE